MRPLTALTLLWWLPLAPAFAAGDREAAVQEAERSLKQAKLGTAGPALLQFVKERTPPPAQDQKVQALIAALGAGKFAAREKAGAALLKLGPAARAQLRQAAEHTDREIARRAGVLFQKIPAGTEPELAEAALRLLADRKPAGAAAALLAYLPHIADDSVLEEARAALSAVAVRDGKPEPAVVAALADSLKLRRSAAAEALLRAGVAAKLPDVLQVIPGLPPAQRLPVAVALVETRQKVGVPLLIDLLRELPTAEVWQAEETLFRLAGEQSPNAVVSRRTPAAEVQALWRAWWKKHGAALDLEKWAAGPKMLGYTLVSQAEGKKKSALGRVFELGPNKQVRWEIGQLRYAIDAQVVGHNRVLIAEYYDRRVTERDFAGKMLWEFAVDQPIACQRLANGHTFIVTRSQLVEVDRRGQEVWRHQPTTTSIAGAQKLRNGQIVLVTAGECRRLEAGTNKVLHSFPVGLVYNLGGNIEVLPNGHVLVPEYADDRVVEYDLQGKPRWQVETTMPTSVSRLANGNVLVVSMRQQRAVEINRAGAVVSEFVTDGRPYRIRRR